MERNLFIILLLLFACNNSDNPKSVKNRENIDRNSGKVISSVNENLILDSLYRQIKIIPSTHVAGDFSLTHSFLEKSQYIHVESEKKINDYSIKYEIDFLDDKSLYREDKFQPEEGFKFISSSFSINGIKSEIKNSDRFVNNRDHKIDPANIWYGEDYGYSLKYYHLRDRDVFIIRGLNLYCNGRNCQSYQLFIIQKVSDKVIVDVLASEDISPYEFENLQLFDENNDGNPEFYNIRTRVEKITSMKDFELFTIYPFGVRKAS